MRFTMREIWGDGAERPDDTLDAEIFAHWVEPAPEGVTTETADAP